MLEHFDASDCITQSIWVLKNTKNIFYSFSIQDHSFLMDVLKKLFYGKPCRFLLHIAFLILPFLSSGQLLHMETNALPIVGLENKYIEQQENIESLLFIVANTIIAKDATTLFFVTGSMQINTFLVAQTTISKQPISLYAKMQIKINRIAKETATDVKQSDNQLAVPYLPCKKNPLQQEIFCAAVATVYEPSTPALKKKNNNPYQLEQAGSNLQLLICKASFYAVIVTSHAAMSYRKNITQFSSRPPPVSVHA